MKMFFLNAKLLVSFVFLALLTACGDREDGPSEIINARPLSPYYFVKKGDTLADVAAHHSMKEEELIALNNLKAPYTLFERQRVLVRVIGKGNSDYNKPGGDVTVKELDADETKDAEKDEDKENSAVDPLAPSSDASLGDALMTDGADSAASVVSDATPSFGAKHAAAKGAVAASASVAPVAFDWPVKGKILTKFGQKMPDGTVSDSLQISAPVGTKVKAAAAGKVQKAGETVPGFGKIVVVKHNDGKLSLYAHLKEVSAKPGQKIIQGQELGRVGTKGKEPMLLFQVRKMVGKKFIATDPAELLP